MHAVIFFASGWLGIWSSTFGLWSELFFARTGRHIYPFLGAKSLGKRVYAVAALVMHRWHTSVSLPTQPS